MVKRRRAWVSASLHPETLKSIELLKRVFNIRTRSRVIDYAVFTLEKNYRKSHDTGNKEEKMLNQKRINYLWHLQEEAKIGGKS